MTHVPVCHCIAEEKDSWDRLQWSSLLSLGAGIRVGWTVQLGYTQSGAKCKFCASIEPKFAPVLFFFFTLEQIRIPPALMHTRCTKIEMHACTRNTHSQARTHGTVCWYVTSGPNNSRKGSLRTDLSWVHTRTHAHTHKLSHTHTHKHADLHRNRKATSSHLKLPISIKSTLSARKALDQFTITKYI